jgi:ATP-binding cassette subfamily B protein
MPSVTPSLVTHAFARVRPVGALWRLRGYLKPYRTQMIVMFAAAFGAVTAEIAIPLLTKSVIDGAIAHHDKSLLIPLSLAAVGLGASEGLLNMIRRWIQAGAVSNIEKSIRDDLYAHLQRLQASFHDDWQSGQLLSRATTDLSAIRRFAGFGLIFLVTNIMTFLAVVALLIHLNWWLGLITGVVFAPVLPVCFRFEKRYRVLSRRVQDQQGDLATLIEEAATGVRVLKALGRGRQAAARHDAQAGEVCQTQVEKAGLLGSFWALLDLIPNAVIGLIIVLGAVAVSTHSLTLGGLVAFITLALQLVWPVEAMGYIIASGQEAATAAQRVLEIFDAEPEITDKDSPERAGVHALAPGRGPRLAVPPGVRPRLLRLSGGGRAGASRHRARPDARPDARAHRGDRLGQVDHAAARAAAGRPDLGVGPAGRGGRAGPPAGAAAPCGRLRLRGRHAVLRQRQGERDVRRAGRG